MKKLFFLASAFLFVFAATAQQKPDDLVKMNIEKYDFGKIKQGVPATTYFTMTNISSQPVKIEQSWAGCGCTTPEVSKEPIAPNGTSKIKVGFNAGAVGPFTKEVYVKLAGINDTKIIKITGEVLDATAYEAYTQTDEYKKAEKARLAMEAKEAKANKKAAKKAKKNSASTASTK